MEELSRVLGHELTQGPRSLHSRNSWLRPASRWEITSGVPAARRNIEGARWLRGVALEGECPDSPVGGLRFVASLQPTV